MHKNINEWNKKKYLQFTILTKFRREHFFLNLSQRFLNINVEYQ